MKKIFRRDKTFIEYILEVLIGVSIIFFVASMIQAGSFVIYPIATNHLDTHFWTQIFMLLFVVFGTFWSFVRDKRKNLHINDINDNLSCLEKRLNKIENKLENK